MPKTLKPKADAVLRDKQKKGKHDRWDHNASALSQYKVGVEKRAEKRKRGEMEMETEALNSKLDRQMTDVYKRVEALDRENWSKKMKKDHDEMEFVRLGGIPLTKNKCTFRKHLERLHTQRKDTDEKIRVEQETGIYDLAEGSKVTERRKKNALRGLEVTVSRKRQAKKDGYIHRTALGQDKRGEVVLDRKKVKQMEIRTLKKKELGSSKGRGKTRGSMWDDKYDINKFNDPRALASGLFDKMGSNAAPRKGGRQGGRAKAGKKRKR
eukprot:TRINITY_DN3040_c0_g2_i1.p1 TRINITY_DN3040_c0_g2~~TRINITY_DN3040_c0_g2_i1.p1  ORF type:complete len:267 (+),score=119.62 TRINITY_DN3040_c0_g2_i1:878-1678(+)